MSLVPQEQGDRVKEHNANPIQIKTDNKKLPYRIDDKSLQLTAPKVLSRLCLQPEPHCPQQGDACFAPHQSTWLSMQDEEVVLQACGGQTTPTLGCTMISEMLIKPQP